MPTVDELDAQAENLRDIIRRLGEKKEVLEQEVTKLEESHADLLKTTEKLEANLENIRNIHTREQSEMVSLRSELSENKKRLDGIKDERNVHLNEFAKIQKEKEKVEKETNELIASIKDIEADRTAEIEKMKKRVLKKEEELLDKQDVHRKEIDRLRREESEAKHDLASLNLDIEFLKKMISDKREELEQEEAAVAACRQELSIKNNQLDDLEKEILERKAIVAQEQKRFESVNQDVRLAKEEIEVVEARLAEVRAELDAEMKKAVELHNAQMEVLRKEAFVKTKYDELGISYN